MNQRMHTHPFRLLAKAGRRGFSLVEMLIVIALIAVIGTLVVGQLGRFFSGAQEDVAKQFVTTALKAPLMKYRIDTGSYPTAADGGLNALLVQPASKAGKWKGPYIDNLPNDPWGNPYQYRFPGVKNPGGYDLWSLGPSGESSEADFIGNW